MIKPRQWLPSVADMMVIDLSGIIMMTMTPAVRRLINS